jgi:uncharacterized protein
VTLTRFQILALDGGGIKGLFSAAVLAALEEDLGTTIAQHFDLIAGTSTGGIIALALGLGVRPKEIVEFYATEGHSIFKNPYRWRSVQQWFFRKYSQEPLKKALTKVLGQRTLGDSTKRLVIPAYNLGENDVYLFKTPHHPRLTRDWRVPAWQVALATSAAPTYFPASKHVGNIRHIDGGVWANNPTLVGILEATSMLGVDLRDIRVFNLGTTAALAHRRGLLDIAGRFVWAADVVDVLLQAQSCGTYAQTQHLIGKDKIERLMAVRLPLVPGRRLVPRRLGIAKGRRVGSASPA